MKPKIIQQRYSYLPNLLSREMQPPNHNVGLLYYYGNGVTKDLGQTLQWFQKAATQGDEKAKAMVERVQGELDDIKFTDVVKVYEDVELSIMV